MKAALSIVLAGLLVTTPLKLVLAQAAEQEAATVQQTASPDSSGHRLIRVPPVTDKTARLWEPLASEDALADVFAKDGSLPDRAPRDIPKAVKIPLYFIAVVAITVVVLGGLLLLICAVGDGSCFE